MFAPRQRVEIRYLSCVFRTGGGGGGGEPAIGNMYTNFFSIAYLRSFVCS